MFAYYLNALRRWLNKVSVPPKPPCYAFYDGLKVYGETEEDRQRVLMYLRGDLPDKKISYDKGLRAKR